mmetsp:Transcript_1802/g.2387  ORF Transcript_1802/g.2387 Transcript_1802/m.2387 type:complete len:112 (+) Transcript_1802:1988-2323(+)
MASQSKKSFDDIDNDKSSYRSFDSNARPEGQDYSISNQRPDDREEGRSVYDKGLLVPTMIEPGRISKKMTINERILQEKKDRRQDFETSSFNPKKKLQAQTPDASPPPIIA